MDCVIVSQGGMSFDIVSETLSEYLGCRWYVWDWKRFIDAKNVIIVGNPGPRVTMVALHYRNRNQIWYIVAEGVPIYTPARVVAKDLTPYIITPSRNSRRNLELLGIYVDRIVPNALRFKPLDPERIGVIKRKNRFLYIGFYDHRKYPPFSRRLVELLGGELTVVTTSSNKIVHDNGKPLCNVIYNDDMLSDDDILSLYFKHKMYLSLTTLEGFGMPIVEAMSQGCIPVVPDTEPFNEICSTDTCWFYRLTDNVVEITHNYQIMMIRAYDPEELYRVTRWIDYDYTMAINGIKRSHDFLPDKVYSVIREFMR